MWIGDSTAKRTIEYKTERFYSQTYHRMWRLEILQLDVPRNVETRNSTAKRTTECGV